MPSVSRDSEVAASYIAKMIPPAGQRSRGAGAGGVRLLGGVGPIRGDQHRVVDGFRQGNYGLMMKGDPAIPESFDVAKPSFNATGCCT
jgi:hypothetical protein